MRRIASVDQLESIVGAPRTLIRLKAIDALDDGCRSVLAAAPVAWFGFRDRAGIPHTTLIGGSPGFVRVESPTHISFDLREPVPAGGVSFVFLLPGIGETLRVNGRVTGCSGARVAVDVQEAFVHCARCVLRSGLWSEAPASEAPASEGPTSEGASMAEFLAAAPFAAVSSWDGDGFADTSPKGDHPGFIRILDSRTLAVPDRRGNRRTDTFHNVLTCDRISLGAVVPGRADVLHISGTANVTDEPALLRAMTVGHKPPKAALVVRIDQAEIAPNEAIRAADLWSRSSHVDPATIPDLMGLAAQHLASNKARGAQAAMARAVSRGVAASPGKLLRRTIDRAYRKNLTDEGY